MSEPLPQAIVTPITPAAIFLVVTLKEGKEAEDNIRSFCPDLSALRRTVSLRDRDARLTCVMGIGSEAWNRLFPDAPRPKELHPFKELKGVHHAVSTAGDLLFHIRAHRMDICFEMASLIMERIRSAVQVQDEVHGFKYFDSRALIGFVDGTENPEDEEACEAVLIGEDDPDFKNGSYVIVQKYFHNLDAWNKLPVEMQEKIIGRKKLSNVELDDETKPDYAHNALTVIERDGEELAILRDNMPFGEIGKGEFGTYFIGYARSPSVTEEMLENMFIGRPKGNYDRLLDFSTPVTGCLFFTPSSDFLDEVE
ncbi:Dyp-type peroxidase family [Zymomonas mobilis subsp. mobilis ZM4 = ATCC 31821]|uniref:Dyp-type peroxidase family n=1 Tax=Zymomonas mobilis subsp. mobilis (strain ATCC 31821 / ZM4 / CP4) TaxID=264203 RepID=Q5NM63_ZYMMO|nr:Dyp-type peroxidase [Zymomonas mobilis]AAV90197.1 Dyp-type peroxidase family [Zymomonas mobilis subsp. mobilis ZM4 = ATCC 31821]AVZ26403.1 Dyp-type peroxidase family [Zymomonas mobilis subsp. mobilis]AVZ28290.1 Dyp-type peroxidase family [Zymomonas mobilis subsp. mobilis]AVZ42735.1 Dyp-type peroxidase family [Zymomonas mobilis subsp. mobilis ZM4 = ATCC 31821]UBQ07497.1 Dyp-type peroxidase [Zymomonas mobilis]